MKIIEKFMQEFPNHNWELKKESSVSYSLICDDNDTGYKITKFNNMFIPGFSNEERVKMTKENVVSIIKQIKEKGI